MYSPLYYQKYLLIKASISLQSPEDTIERLMKMNILGIACSPRPRGNSTILLEKAIEQLSIQGNITSIIRLRELKFKPCIGCEACSKTGICIFKDDLVDLFQKIEDTDKLIIAAPVFSMNINALAKGMIDRAQMYWARKYVLKASQKPLKPGMFISTAGMNLPEVHHCSKKTIRYFYKMLDVEYKLDFFVNQVDAPGEILAKSNELTELRAAIKTF